MLDSKVFKRCTPVALAAASFVFLASIQAGAPDPKVLSYNLPDQLKWNETSSGALESVVLGDPSKAGLYIILVKWRPHRMSHPHYHPNDRFATVISGTWWVGTGPKFDPDSTTPLPPGSTATHFGKQIHYDGAKDQEVILEIVGQGPETATNAEQK